MAIIFKPKTAPETVPLPEATKAPSVASKTFAELRAELELTKKITVSTPVSHIIHTTIEEPVIETIIEEPVTIQQPEELDRKYIIENKKVKGVASGETSLVVNGRTRSIGRKSHYLLDMLTLDD